MAVKTSDSARMDRAHECGRLPMRAQLASGAARCHSQAGHAGVVLQPARRTQPARGAPAGGARGTQHDRPRHPRHTRARFWRDPDAGPGRATRRRTAPAAFVRAKPRDGHRTGSASSARSSGSDRKRSTTRFVTPVRSASCCGLVPCAVSASGCRFWTMDAGCQGTDVRGATA